MTRTESRIRALLIAEQCDPDAVSVPLEGWSHSRAIAELPEVAVHTVTQVRYRDRVFRAGADPQTFTMIDSESVARPMWRLEEMLRGGSGKGWTTVMALRALSYGHFERLVQRQFGPSLAQGAFDIVHRVTPLSPTIGSPLARCTRQAKVPFVLGPLNGGLPWPRSHVAVRWREREWLSYLRGAYRLLPTHRVTREAAAALIMGSVEALSQESDRVRERCVYIPENGVDLARFSRVPCDHPRPPPLRVAFVGRLVPYKGADILVEAAAPLIRDGALVLDLIGDGPERARIDALCARERIEHSVERPGWVAHDRMQDRLGRAHVFGFPSVREFGGAVVLEAMALGVVPIVVDYGGPGELVSPRTGVAIPLGDRRELVERFRVALGALAADPSRLERMAGDARARVRAHFTWTAKARQVLEVYRWVLGRRTEKPDFGMPIPDSEDAPTVGARSSAALGPPSAELAHG